MKTRVERYYDVGENMINKNRKYNILIVENKIKGGTENIEIYLENNCKSFECLW